MAPEKLSEYLTTILHKSEYNTGTVFAFYPVF